MRLAALFLFALTAAEPPAAPPAPCLALPCTVARVKDGDTLTATLTLTVSVRLLDCWAPELDEPRGPEARDRLVALAAGKPAILQIPLTNPPNLDHALTLGRLLGRVWIDGRDIGARLIEERLATRTKPQPPRVDDP